MARRLFVWGLTVLVCWSVSGRAAPPAGVNGEWVMRSGDSKTYLKVNDLEFVWTCDDFVLTVTRESLANGEASGTVRNMKVMGSGIEVTIAKPQPFHCKLRVIPDGLEVRDLASPGDIKIPKEAVEGVYRRD
jgi:hypothetical protein